MFLGNLSTANEHKARKTNGKKKVKSTDVKTQDEIDGNESSVHSNATSVSKTVRLLTPIGPVIYNEQSESIPRNVLVNYLTNCSEMLLNMDCIAEIVDDSVKRSIGLQIAAIEFQRDVLENNFQIERNFGCNYLSLIPVNHGDDKEVIDCAKQFMYTALKSYLVQLKYRKDKYIGQQLNVSIPMTRVQILEFFEGSNAKMVMKETKDELKKIYKTTGKIPSEKCIQYQHEILELLGFHAPFGVSCLNKIPKDFSGDTELLTKMQYFGLCAQMAGEESMMTDLEHQTFYDQLPPLMHHFPHIYIMQQRMAKQKQMQKLHEEALEHERKMNGTSRPDGQKDGNLAMKSPNDIDAIKRSGILQVLQSPDGRQKMQELSYRLQSHRELIDQMVNEWDMEQKKDFVKSFTDSEQFNQMEQFDDDPLKKLQAFMSMPESDLMQLMKLQTVFATCDGEALIEEAFFKKDGEVGQAIISNQPGDDELKSVQAKRIFAMKNMVASMKTFGNVKPRGGVVPPSAVNAMSGDHTHQHDHAASESHHQQHVHGEHCNHHSHNGGASVPNITAGTGDKMDR